MERLQKNMTCIICPKGCAMTVTKDGDKIEVSGNTCKKGADYAVSELTCPTRTITSVVKITNRKDTMVSVKTSVPVEKKYIFDVMKVIISLEANAPVKIGDVLKADVFGADIIATKDID